jgi:hypothetical protein
VVAKKVRAELRAFSGWALREGRAIAGAKARFLSAAVRHGSSRALIRGQSCPNALLKCRNSRCRSEDRKPQGLMLQQAH